LRSKGNDVVTRRWRAFVGKLQRWDGLQDDRDSEPGRLHRWLPIAIVAVSVGAAAMGWQASVADERATVRDESSRQDFVAQQQAHIQALQAVSADVRLFAEVERYRTLGGTLLVDAKFVPGSERDELTRVASSDQALAKWLESQLQFGEFALADPTEPYNVELARIAAESGDRHLSSLEPNELHAAARSQRGRGLHLVGLAVLFIVALFFFTCAEVTDVGPTARRKPGVSGDIQRSGGKTSASEVACHLFAGSGLLVTAGALVTFVIVRML
jgi:hypothetical protein